MTAAFPSPAWLVGCGNMAGAMVEGWRVSGVDLSHVRAIRPSGRPVAGIETLTAYPPGEEPRFVMLGFKPQGLDQIAPGLGGAIGPETTLVSMLAGVSAASLRARFPKAGTIVRIMPNLPVAQRQGVIALYSDDGGPAGLPAVDELMACLGITTWCRTESELGAIGVIASAGVAYVARFADALAQGGVGLGLDQSIAQRLALQTLVGTGAHAVATGNSMTAIARRVASPGGTTQRGLDILDGKDGLMPLIARTLEAAVRRGEELAAEAASRD